MHNTRRRDVLFHPNSPDAGRGGDGVGSKAAGDCRPMQEKTIIMPFAVYNMIDDHQYLLSTTEAHK